MQLHERAAGASFSFSCTGSTGDLSSSELTKFVALAVKRKVDGLKDNKAAGKIYRPPQTGEGQL